MGKPIRNRVKELRQVKASTLLPHPLNYRKHPKRQQDLLSQLLSEIGYADAILVRETPGGLQIIDGHLRADTTPDALVPVLVLDLNEAEAKKLLLTLDPLASLAETDATTLEVLLGQVSLTGDLDAWLKERALDAGIGALVPDPAPQPDPLLRGQCLVEIYCSPQDLNEFRDTLDDWARRKGVRVQIV